MRRLLIIACFSALWLGAKADLLSDLASRKYRADQLTITEVDAQRYAQQVGKNVYAYSYKTGAVTDTLFDIARTRDVKIDTIEGFVLDPKGKTVLVYNKSEKLYRRSFKATYYVYNIARHELKPLSNSPICAPVYSPDGRYIAFTRNGNLFIHKLDYSTEVAVTEDGGGNILNGQPDWLYEEEFATTALYSFSPDSKQLAFVRFDETNVPEMTWQEMLDEQGHALRYPTNKTIRYPKAGDENAKVSVVVYDTYYKSLKTMDLGDLDNCYVPRIVWTNSNDALAAFVLNRNQNRMDMFFANPKSTVARRVLTEESKDYCIDYSVVDEMQFLTDNAFTWISEGDGYRHIYLYNAAGVRQHQLTKGQFDVTAFYGYDEKTGMLYYQSTSNSTLRRAVYALNTKKQKTQCLTKEDGTHSALFTKDFAYFVDAFSSFEKATCYTLLTNQGQVVREMKNNREKEQAFKAFNLPKKELYSLTTERGDTLYGWILRPADFDATKRYPVVQIQYSGPASQEAKDVWQPDWEYFLASQGYICVCVDGRGTAARGKAWRARTYMHFAKTAAEDQVSVARHMQQLPYVDAEKIAIWGWSFGGFMSVRSMMMPQSPFCCGIAVAPVTDFRLYDTSYTERYMRRPQSNDTGYDDCNLMAMADSLQGRLLLVHGLADDNVHCQNTWLLADALVQAGKQFDMQVYTDDNHFLRKRKNITHLYARMYEFLNTNLKGK